MSSADPLLVLWNDAMRAKAIAWIKAAPDESRVVFKAPKRTLPQNDKLHAMLTDIAQQRLHDGLKLTVTDWKRLFTASLRRELRMVKSLAGDSMVLLGASTSEMSVAEVAELITYVTAWGDQNGIVFSEPKEPRPLRRGARASVRRAA